MYILIPGPTFNAKSQITLIGHLYLDVFNLEKSSMILPDLDMFAEFGPDCL